MDVYDLVSNDTCAQPELIYPHGMIVVQMQKNTIFLVIGVLIIVLVAVLFTLIQGTRPLESSPVLTVDAAVTPGNDSTINNWKDVPLRDVSTAGIFSVRELEGKPVLLFCFTTWCSICTAQQSEIKRLQAISPGSFTSVGIDIDPYENEAVVRKHQSDNGFPGLYAVAPPELTNELVNEFGVDMITPASAPMILICSNGTVTRLDRGIKSAGFLEQAIRTRC
jgi:cytochrome oxidase Cu insertion factor (SCO1/SenC/PrrC family)